MERSLRAIMDIRAQMGSKPGPYASARMSPSAGCGHAAALALGVLPNDIVRLLDLIIFNSNRTHFGIFSF